MAAPKRNTESADVGDDGGAPKPVCGVVRPIAGIDGYPEGHWLEVHQTITEAAEIAGYDARLVSDDEAIGVILGRIVTNLHDLPIVVVDVSGLNPNVFFELGMRLTFDKPTVVIKDDLTRYPFDASPIEYIPYPASLRHSPLMTFRAKLATAIAKTAETAGNTAHRTFLKHFGSVQPGTLGEDQTLSSSLILDEIRSLKGMVRRQTISPTPRASHGLIVDEKGVTLSFKIKLQDEKSRLNLYNAVLAEFGPTSTSIHEENGISHLTINAPAWAYNADQLRVKVSGLAGMFGGHML